jgi:hypothetical protein
MASVMAFAPALRLSYSVSIARNGREGEIVLKQKFCDELRA